MSNFFRSSLGKKVIVSLSGLFLILFLLIHLTANLFLLAGSDAYNIATHFMDSNPIIQIMQPILALGFFFHILWGLIVQIKNWRSTPVKYRKVNQWGSSSWSSRNMIWLGIFIFGFLTLHIINFFYVMKFGEMSSTLVHGEEMHDTYTLVVGLFTGGTMGYIFSTIYIISFVALGFHLNHAFWSAFQSIGWSNDKWRKRLSRLGLIYTLVVCVGFTIIPIYFLFIK